MPDLLDPNDFVITRKRKKYKFAKFHNAENCFELSEWTHHPIDVLEIGAGTGLFSVELATKYPEKTFLALDVKADRLQKGAYAALERGLRNIYFVRARADQIDQLVVPHSLAAIWITFPDPFPRQRSAGRRLTHPTFLRKYRQSLKVDPSREDDEKHQSGRLYLKHDNTDFFHWSLEQLVAEKWRIIELGFDLHDSGLETDARILTTYERRWLAEGRITNYLAAAPPESII